MTNISLLENIGFNNPEIMSIGNFSDFTCSLSFICNNEINISSSMGVK